jgi:exosome complex exonuclease DIS3/RRP44
LPPTASQPQSQNNTQRSIVTRQAAALMDQRIVVAIDAWDADSAYPAGHYVRSLGPIGDKDTETVAF